MQLLQRLLSERSKILFSLVLICTIQAWNNYYKESSSLKVITTLFETTDSSLTTTTTTSTASSSSGKDNKERKRGGKESSIAISQSSLPHKIDEDQVPLLRSAHSSFPKSTMKNSSSSSSSSKVVPTPRLGILLLGLGIRDSDVPSGHYNISAEETAKICKEMFSRHVVNPAKNVGYEVDFFAHSWNPEAEESMNRLFKPVKSIYEKYTGPRSKPGFMEWMDWRPEHFYDLEEGVSMVSRYAEENELNYEWILVTRFDAVFFSKLRLDVLDSRKFYVSNWCTLGKNTPVFEGEDKTCYPLMPFFVERKGAIPDFFSLASLDLTKKVYIGLIEAKKKGSLIHRGPNNHGVLYSRLSQLKVPMGRHLFRTFDVHIARYSGWALKNLTKEGGGYNNLRLTGGRGQFMRWNSATKSLRYVPKNELSLMMGDIDVRAEYDWPQYIGSRCTSSEMVYCVEEPPECRNSPTGRVNLTHWPYYERSAYKCVAVLE